MLNNELLKSIERQTNNLKHLADKNEIDPLDYITLTYTKEYQEYRYNNMIKEVAQC